MIPPWSLSAAGGRTPPLSGLWSCWYEGSCPRLPREVAVVPWEGTDPTLTALIAWAARTGPLGRRGAPKGDGGGGWDGEMYFGGMRNCGESVSTLIEGQPNRR